MRFARTHRLLVLTCSFAGAGVVLVRFVGGCSDASSDSEFGCGDDASVTIVPYAAPGVPVVLSDGAVVAPTGLTITGSVVGAPCGVQNVSVLSAVQAMSDLQNFATWSAVVPLSLLESTTPCDAGLGTGDGVWVYAQASVISDPGTANLVIDGGVCVSLTQPTPPGVCSEPSIACPLGAALPSPYAGPSAVKCQLPLVPGPPATFAVLTSQEGLNRQVTWKSVGGLTTIEPQSPFVASNPNPGLCVADAGCDCSGASIATVVGTSTAQPGVDYVTATIDGYPTPIATITVAVQGAAKISASATALSNGTSVFLTVPNPMGFAQTCSIAIPVGVQVAGVGFDGGAPPALQLDAGACAVPEDAGGVTTQNACITQDSFATLARVYAVSFLDTLNDMTARAAGLSNTRFLSIVCTDQFSQAGSSSLSVVWTFAPDAGAATSGTDGGGEGGADGGADASLDASDASD